MSTETPTSPSRVLDPNTIQLRIALRDVEPTVWRRLVVPIDTTLAQLLHILQAAMGWTGSEPHRFEIGGLHYGDAAPLEMNSLTIGGYSIRAWSGCATSIWASRSLARSRMSMTSMKTGDTR